MTMYRSQVIDSQLLALPTVSTASGSIATFETDMTENLVEVKCQIVAQQSGSGTPSPSNPRPIQTYTEMNVFATGKNFINVPDTTVSVANYVFNYTDLNIPKGEYTFSFDTDYTGGMSLAVGGDNREYYNGVISGVRSVYASDKITKIRLYTSGAGTFSNIQLERGATRTAYEPFNGTTETIPFGQTVYGGRLNVGSGVLTVTHGYKDLGTLTWLQDSAYGSYFYTSGFSDKAIGLTNMICTEYGNATRYGNQQPDLTIRGAESGNYHRLFVRNNAIADATAFNTAIQGVMLCYELDTPTTIQLDSIQIQALLNENNIWCDTGDTSVKYILSVGKAIS